MDKRLKRAVIAAYGVILIVNGSIGGGLLAHGLLKNIGGMPNSLAELTGGVTFFATALTAAYFYFSEDKKDFKNGQV